MAHSASRSFAEELKSLAARLLEVHEAEIARTTRKLTDEICAVANLNKRLQSQLAQPPHPPQRSHSVSTADDTVVTDLSCNSDDDVPRLSRSKSHCQGSMSVITIDDITTAKDNGAWVQQMSLPNVPGQAYRASLQGQDREDDMMVKEISSWSDEGKEAWSLQSQLPNGSGKKARGTGKRLRYAADIEDDGASAEIAHPPERATSFGQQRSSSFRSASADLTGSTGVEGAAPARNQKHHKLNTEAFVIGLRSIWDANAEEVDMCSSRLSIRVNNSPNKSIVSTTWALKNKADHASNCCSIMHPVGSTRLFWNFACLALIIYDLFTIPLQAFDLGESAGMDAVEWFLTVWWTFDVFMTFRTGFFIAATLEMRPWFIARHYAKSWLVVDLLIVLLEWANRFAVTMLSGSFLRTSRVFRTMRLTKLLRVTKLQSLWATLQEYINSNLIQLCCTMVCLTGVLLLTVHFVSCLWYWIGDSRDDGWVTYDLYTGEKNTMFWYIASTRWVISQLNGRTDMDERRNMLERLITCTIGVALAVIAHAIFISVITKTILDLGELVSEKTRRRQLVNAYIAEHALAPWLRAQVKRCLHDYSDIRPCAQEEKVLEILPKHLQTDLLYEVRAPVITQHQLFFAFGLESQWVMRYLCRRVVQMVSASKYEVIFDTGDVSNRMLFTDKLAALYGEPSSHSNEISSQSPAQHFVRSATRQLTSPTKVKQDELGVSLLRRSSGILPRPVPSGSWISEPALWSEWRNRGRLVADGSGILLALQAQELAQALEKHHPDAFILASLYATCFVAELRKQALYDLSDILPFDIQVLSPVVLKITIASATGLPDSSNPYCVCKSLGLSASNVPRFKTVTKDRTANPVWNHVSELGLAMNQPLEFSVFNDTGRPESDNLLGTARLNPEAFFPIGFQGDIPFDCPDGADKGSLNVVVDVLEAEQEEQPKMRRTMRYLRKTVTTSWQR